MYISYGRTTKQANARTLNWLTYQIKMIESVCSRMPVLTDRDRSQIVKILAGARLLIASLHLTNKKYAESVNYRLRNP